MLQVWALEALQKVQEEMVAWEDLILRSLCMGKGPRRWQWDPKSHTLGKG